MSDYIIHNGTLMSEELYHYGVKGMKWGHRRKRPYAADGDGWKPKRNSPYAVDGEGWKPKHKIKSPGDVGVSPTAAKVIDAIKNKRTKSSSHNKDYSDKQRKQDRAFYGKGGERRVNKKMNEGYGLRGARHFEAERKERNDKREKTAKKIAKKGAAITASALGTVGMMYVRDQAFNGGKGTAAVKKAVKNIGRAIITANVYRKGGWDVHWYDN